MSRRRDADRWRMTGLAVGYFVGVLVVGTVGWALSPGATASVASLSFLLGVGASMAVGFWLGYVIDVRSARRRRREHLRDLTRESQGIKGGYR